MSQDIIADVLNLIMNAKKAKKNSVETKRHSKLLLSVLAIAKLRKYIKDYKIQDGILRIEIADVSGCNAIKPRFMVKV